jgi:single stranded DNA-binding protein
MAQGDILVTIIGNLTNDPELRFTPSGAAVASFTVASSSRLLDKQTNEWKDGDTTFLRCNVWRQYAENVAESLQRGMRVIVNGRLKQRSYETKEGEKRTVYEVEVDDVGPALRYATADPAVAPVSVPRPRTAPPTTPGPHRPPAATRAARGAAAAVPAPPSTSPLSEPEQHQTLRKH